MKKFERETNVVYHFRKRDKDGKKLAKGGVTFVYSPVTKMLGYACCNPSDNFCKKLGIRIAEGRIAKNKKCFDISIYDNVIDDIKYHIRSMYGLICPD